MKRFYTKEEFKDVLVPVKGYVPIKRTAFAFAKARYRNGWSDCSCSEMFSKPMVLEEYLPKWDKPKKKRRE